MAIDRAMNLLPPDDAVLEVKGLKTYFQLSRDNELRAVDDVSFKLHPGHTLCIVGESGSGKSITARSILQIVPHPGRIVAGSILYRDNAKDPPVDLAGLRPHGRAIRAIRGRRIGMVFQEPMTSLSPIHRIGWQIAEALLAHGLANRREAERRAVELLRQVEIPSPETAATRYSFEFSGGMRQRAMIAIALAASPKLLLADEPTTALDVTIQDQILKLLKRLTGELGMAMILVTHDLGVVAETCDRVSVMYAGRVAETAPVEALFAAPRHAYTHALLRSAPQGGQPRTPLSPIRGQPPQLSAPMPGCAFAPRCDFAQPACGEGRPALVELSPLQASACLARDRLPAWRAT